MRVLVTGGAGYIGSHTVKLLRERGDQVVVLDTLEHGHQAAIGATPLIVGSTQDQGLVKEVIVDHKIEAVIHFAAYKAAGESMIAPAKYFDNNVHGTLRLLQAVRLEGVKYFVFSSTAAIYGTPKTLPVRETDEFHPENPYGESKLMVEQMLRWFDACHGLRSIALRYFNAAGAWPDGGMGEDPRRAANLVPLVMNAATGRSPDVKVFGTDYPTPDGSCIRDYIHVMDLAEAHARALDYLREQDRTDAFNLGTGKGASVLEVLNAARRITGVDIRAEHVARRPGDPVAVFADNTKARTLLGWTPKYGLEEIIASAWKWSSSHPDGYK
ncbi:MAG TPA: UDP-glucose 4-epimerase GalE [Polyangia bacterium]|nr:UDP-glucose 4-epimerase GalE [Polyangia bacterium]